MKLYYTGSSTSGEAQENPRLSLGNYPSTTEVPSGFVGATLQEISRLSKQRDDRFTFMLALLNTTGSQVDNVTIYYDYPTDGQYKIELAFVSPTQDGDGNDVFERISSPQALPLTGTFAEYSGVGNSTDIGSIANNGYVGIWVKATLVADNVAQRDCATLYTDFEAGTELALEEEISFVISYT